MGRNSMCLSFHKKETNKDIGINIDGKLFKCKEKTKETK